MRRMKRHLMIMIALGLAASGCKKDEKAKDGDKPASGSASGSEKASGSDTASGSGSASASGTGMASASGSGEASGTGSGTDVGTGSGTGMGTDTVAPVAVGNSSPEGGDVMLQWKPDPVGHKYDKSEIEHAELVFGDTPVTLDRTKLRHVEVVESGDFVTKVKVQFETHHEVQTAEGNSKTKPNAVEGKSYVVWREADKIAATHDDGSAVSPEELEEIGETFDDEVGVRPGIVDMLLRHPWKTGEVTKLDATDLADMTRDLKEGASVTEGTVTLQSVDGKTAVFALVMTVAASGEAVGTNTANATFILETDPMRPMVIEGEVGLDVTVKGTKMTGKTKQSEKYTYR